MRVGNFFSIFIQGFKRIRSAFFPWSGTAALQLADFFCFLDKAELSESEDHEMYNASSRIQRQIICPVASLSGHVLLVKNEGSHVISFGLMHVLILLEMWLFLVIWNYKNH